MNDATFLKKISGRARAAMFYFFYMAAIGATAPFLYLVYRQHGLSPAEIGLLVAVAHVMNFVAAPLWGAANDLLQRKTSLSLLPVACLGAGPAILLILYARGLAPTLLAVVVWGFFAGSIISLADAATMRMLGKEQHFYGRVRVWGSLGGVLASFLVGQFGTTRGLNIVFPTYFVMLVACALLSFGFPKVHFQAREIYTREAGAVLRSSKVVLFLTAILVMTVAYMSWRSTFSLFIDDLKGAANVIGTFFALSSLVEIPVAFSSSWFIRRMGSRNTLVLGFSVLILFWLACSLILSPAVTIPLAAVHGFAYALYDITGVVYVKEVTPEGLSNLAQGLYGGINRGVGSVIGSLAGGILYQNIGGNSLYRISALLGLVALGGLLFIPSTRARGVKVELS